MFGLLWDVIDDQIELFALCSPGELALTGRTNGECQQVRAGSGVRLNHPARDQDVFLLSVMIARETWVRGTCVANLIQPTLETGMTSRHKTIKLYFFLPLNGLSLIVFSCLTTADGVFSARSYLLSAGPRPIKRSPAGSWARPRSLELKSWTEDGSGCLRLYAELLHPREIWVIGNKFDPVIDCFLIQCHNFKYGIYHFRCISNQYISDFYRRQILKNQLILFNSLVNCNKFTTHFFNVVPFLQHKMLSMLYILNLHSERTSSCLK